MKNQSINQSDLTLQKQATQQAARSMDGTGSSSITHASQQNRRLSSTETTTQLQGDSKSSGQEDTVWDLESALLYLTQLGRCSCNGVENLDKSVSKSSSNILLDKKQSPDVATEYLTLEKDSWITFRPAHAGDASSIAQWYLRQAPGRERSQTTNNDDDRNDPTNSEDVGVEVEDPEIDKDNPIQLNSSSTTSDEEGHHRLPQHRRHGLEQEKLTVDSGLEDSQQRPSLLQLEHWLAEGLGDENTCPSVYGLLAYVHRPSSQGDSSLPDGDPKPNSTTKREDSHGTSTNSALTAVALMSLSWTLGRRNLRIEWMAMDPLNNEDESIAVQHKVWLRIHTLSVMTACQAIEMDESIVLSTVTQPQLTQSPQEEKRNEEEPLESDHAHGIPQKDRKSRSTNTRIAPSAE